LEDREIEVDPKAQLRESNLKRRKKKGKRENSRKGIREKLFLFF